MIDTGVDCHHPDLAANIWTNPGESCPGCASDGIDNDGNGYVDDVHGWDFVNDDNDPIDDHGHGTHVAGTIGASGSNGVGVAGVNWNVQIMPLKFIGANGQGTADDAVRAILYATRMGAVASNNSWGGEEFSQALEDAIADADAHGSLFVAAAGNSAKNTDTTPDYPSGFDLPNVLTVGATDQNDVRAWFSNYGKQSVDLAAPGTNIYSTWPGGIYRFSEGTSMAAPHVTGVAALAKAAFPSASAVGLKALILRTADQNASFAGLSTTGGRLNARAAVTCGSGAQAWIESPAPGFEVDFGKPVSVTVVGAACGDPAAAAVGLTANGSEVELAPRGDGLYTGASRRRPPARSSSSRPRLPRGARTRARFRALRFPPRPSFPGAIRSRSPRRRPARMPGSSSRAPPAIESASSSPTSRSEPPAAPRRRSRS